MKPVTTANVATFNLPASALRRAHPPRRRSPGEAKMKTASDAKDFPVVCVGGSAGGSPRISVGSGSRGCFGHNLRRM
jgi:hypothetical protein